MHRSAVVDRSVASRTNHVAGALLLMTAAFIVTKTGRDALYFQKRGLFQLPWAYVGIAMMSGPMAMSILRLMRGLGPRRARLIVPLLMSAGLLAYYPFAAPGEGLVNSIFFMFVPLAWGVMFSLAWLLAADLLEGSPVRVLGRSYGRIGAASILGGILGGIVARLAAHYCEPGDLLLYGVGGLVLSALVMARAQRRFPPAAIDPETINPNGSSVIRPGDYLAVLRDRYAGAMLAVAVLASLVGVLVEFQFYLAAATSGNSSQENVSFFATFYTLLSGAALLVQLFVMPRLQRRAGVGGSLLILPLALLGGASILVVGNATLLLRSGLRLTEGGLKASIHRSNWEQAYLPLARVHRSVYKIIIDGMGARFGEALAAMILLGWLHLFVQDAPLEGRPIAWVSWVLVATTLLWLWMTRRLRRARQAQRLVLSDETDRLDFRADLVPDT